VLFFPLDQRLQLRADQWSGGVARISTRQGLRGKSFEGAAEAVTDAVGCAISRESVRKITQGWGAAVEEERMETARRVFTPTAVEPAMPERMKPIEQQASISSDGGMVHIRDEGWKEVKLTVISAVRSKRASEITAATDSRRYAPYEPQMMLEDHSYQVGLWDADTAGQHQYLESLRRAVPDCPRVSAVADGARWIERVTEENFPDVMQIIDWFHVTEKMWFIGQHFFPDKAPRTQWVNARLNELWHGDVHKTLAALDQLPDTSDDLITSAVGYFARQQHRLVYPRFRIAGCPIGSGCVESGINTVVHHRMKTQGRGWVRQNAQCMLAALSEYHSGRFLQAWRSIQ